MTKKEFIHNIIEEHFEYKIDHLHSAWGHNFYKEFKDETLNSLYMAVCLILEYFNPDDGLFNVKDLCEWLKKDIKSPMLIFGQNKTLMWNLFYAL